MRHSFLRVSVAGVMTALTVSAGAQTAATTPRPAAGGNVVADVRAAMARQDFAGAEDLTPSDFYRQPDAERARESARLVVRLVRPHVGRRKL